LNVRYLVAGAPAKRYKLALLFAALVFCIGSGAGAESAWTGSNTIDYALLQDQQRKKELQVKITYPAAPGRYPVIVFSHGAGGSKDTDAPLTEYWASHGYVCLQPSHADSIALAREQGRRMTIFQLLRTIGNDYAGWTNRVRDVSFVIDSLQALQKNYPQLAQRIDASRIGVGGHSYGAWVSQVLGGAKVNLPSGETSLADRRVKAVLLLSPQGIEPNGFGMKNEHSWDELRVPMMLMTGSLDKGLGGQSPEWRAEPFRYAPPGNKYLVYFKGADHMTFSARRSSPFLATIEKSSLAFWDAFLKDDAAAKKALDTEQFENSEKTVVTQEER
jgi:predicted dienelactone hydrolase